MSKNTNTAVDTASPAVEATAPAPKAKGSTAKVAAAAAHSLKGTPAELIAAGVTLNGKPVDAGLFTMLRKYHYKSAIDTAGYVEKPVGQKGKAAEIVQLLNAPGFAFANPVTVEA